MKDDSTVCGITYSLSLNLLTKEEARLLIARYYRNLLGLASVKLPDEMPNLSKKKSSKN